MRIASWIRSRSVSNSRIAASIPVAGALNYALYYKPYGSEGQAKWLVGAAGLALLAHLADIAMHSKKK